MTESKHTPGPWQWLGKDLEGPNGSEVIYISVDCGAFCQGGMVNLEISEANAKLIAAAPKLLEALKSFIENGYDRETALEAIKEAAE